MITLGTKVDNLVLNAALEKARGFLLSAGQFKIFTPNPEFVVKAQKDEYFREVLNSGDLNLCDGFGLRLVSGAPRITGVDFAVALCQVAAEVNKSVFLLGGLPEAASKAAAELTKQIPGLKIAGFDGGPRVSENYQCLISQLPVRSRYSQSKNNVQFPNNQSTNQQFNNLTNLQIDTSQNQEIINKINASQAAILLVAFGMGKQEKWIYENLSKMPNIRMAMGVGGALDYISSLVPRAPLFLRQIGLEWMYRLIVQPRRIFRILNATVTFLFLVLRSFIISNFKFSIFKQ